MNIRRMQSLSTVALLLAAGTSLSAQVSTGAMNGHVMDSSGKPLAEVRITFESPALFQSRVLKTDKNGLYRAQLLPVGNYTIKVSAEGYMGKTIADVRVGLGSALSVDFTLKAIKEATATVEVMANVAQEAKTDDKVSVNYSAEDLLRLPTERSFDGALSLAPGVSLGSGNFVNIRGASIGDGQVSNSGHGINQVLYRIDGIDVKDDSGVQMDSNLSGKATIYQPLEDSIEDIQVVLSALNARNGRTTGGQVNVVTKSGSNTFEGSIRANISRPSWTANKSHGPSDPENAGASDFESNAGNGYSRHVDVTISGPILKDRLWFYLGTRLQPNASSSPNYLGWPSYPVRVNSDGTTSRLPGTTADYAKYPQITWGMYPGVDHVLMDTANYPVVPGTSRRFSTFNLNDSDYASQVPVSTSYKQYEGKLTGQVTQDHLLTFTYLYSKDSTSGQSMERSSGAYTIFKNMMGDLTNTTKGWSLTWNGTLASNWFIEAKAAKSQRDEGDVLGPTQYPIGMWSWLTSGDPTIKFRDYLGINPGGDESYYGEFGFLRASASMTPSKRANISYNANVKHFVDLGGQHEIDFGFDFFQSQFQFGRERNGNYIVFAGGFIWDKESQQAMFPVMYSKYDTAMFPDDDTLVQDTEQARGPGATLKYSCAMAGVAKNNTMAYYINDNWTINQNWNVMLGVRTNQYTIYDTTGPKIVDTGIIEPRLQVKWNPDGANQRLVTFSWAKLASSYSDEIANWVRTNSWRTQTLQYWAGARNANGAFADQPAVDDLAGTPGGNDNGRYGVRWVTYNQLVDRSNYEAPVDFKDNTQTNNAKNLKVPYGIEYSLGYTRNYDTGHVGITLVQRTYKKEALTFVHNGWYDPNNPAKYLTLIHDPSGITQNKLWVQASNFVNSDLDKVYRSVELSWDKQITSRLKLGGSLTGSQLTGYHAYDYYMWRDTKIKDLGLANQDQWAPSGLLNKTLEAKIFLTYVYPLPNKGNLSASILGNYSGGGNTTSLHGVGVLDSGTMAVPGFISEDGTQTSNVAQEGYWRTRPKDPSAFYFSRQRNYNRYYSGVGDFKTGNDYYSFDVRLQAQIPLAGTVKLVSYVTIQNLFNRILKGSEYGWSSDYYAENHLGGNQDSNSVIPGRPLGLFTHNWGYANGADYYTSGRTFTEFSVGLKF